MFDALRKSGDILGMNARNLKYVRPLNKKRGRRIADDKLLAKRTLGKSGLPVPKLITTIRSNEELESFDWSTLPSGFALKPNRGFGGEGIVVVYGKKKGRNDAWVKADGALVTIEDLRAHIRNILDGSFSLTNSPDVAFFEERLTLLKSFKPYTYKGIPDLRVIVYNHVPVMAMLRLPTKQSRGKANLHQGAIGVGIDLASGTTTSAVMGSAHVLEYVPKTRLQLSGIRIPYWKEILRIAIEAQKVSGLGFLGADIAIDRERGPVLLELNARPGLSIQIANLDGLKRRLERIAGLKVRTTERGMTLGMNLFGGEIEEELEEISGKRVIGSVEKVKLVGKDGKEVEVEAKIDTGAYSTSIDTDLARNLGFGELLDAFERIDLSSYTLTPEHETEIKRDIMQKHRIPRLEDVAVIFSSSGASIRPVVKVLVTIDQADIVARCNIIDRSTLKYPMIVGKRNLGRFLVDVSK